MKRLVLYLTCFICSLPLRAEERLDNRFAENGDSIHYTSSFSSKLDQITDSRLYRMTYLGVPLIAAGFAVKSEDDHFRSLRNDYLPKFNHHADDFLQYTPAVVMLDMKTFGVEGRSS